MPSPVLLAARGIRKTFPGVVALDDVSLAVARGEVLAVVGENGAGKSTLMKILAGIQRPESGEIRLDGEPVRLNSPRDAQRHGVALIHQELNLCDNLDVMANILLGNEPSRLGFLRRTGERHVRELLARTGLDVPPRTPLSRLSIGRRQLVEIAKALSIDARVLIMDEPTSSLTGAETHKLFQVINELRQRGTGVIYISHRLSEVERIADRVTVLRDGRNAGELAGDSIGHDQMVRLMVGRDVSRIFSRTRHTPGEPMLTVRGLATPRWPHQSIDLEVRAGEITGLAGLVGAGRSELLNCIFGVDRPLAGSVSVASRLVAAGSPRAAIAAGMALVPEDRKEQGLLLPWTLTRNTSLPQLRSRFSRGGLISSRGEASEARQQISRLGIRATGPAQIAGLLSGGNQQKVVIGKWLASQPRVLLLDEPTRGIDVGARQEIYLLMEQLAAQGMAILFASSELEEIMGLSDRVLVMRDGRIAGEPDANNLSEESIMSLATGTGRSIAEDAPR